MKAVIGIYEPEDAKVALRRLEADDFWAERVEEFTSIEDVPDYLEGEPEKAAAWGGKLGIFLGAFIGAIGGTLAVYALSLSSLVFPVLMGIAGGAVIGGFLSALYTMRGETQLGMDIHEAIGQGKSMLLVLTNAANADIVAHLMERYNSEHVQIRTVTI